MTTLKGLPAFFQNSGTTVLDELTNFELGGNDDEIALEDDEVLESNAHSLGDDAFGDLESDNLPDYFNSTNAASEGLDVLDSYSSLSISNEARGTTVPDSLYRSAAEFSVAPSHNIYLSPPLSQPVENSRAGGFPVPRPYSAAVSGAVSVQSNTPQKGPPGINVSQFSSPPPQAQAQQQNIPQVPNSHLPNWQQQQQQAAEAPRKEFRRAKNMHPSDIRFIVGKVMQPLQSNDPFADDFYFLQLSIKKNAKAREAAMKEAAAPPPMIYVPLPTWKETKERIKQQIETTRAGFQQKSRDWEEKEQVLGHQVRADVSKPRSVLQVPTLSELDLDAMDGDDENDYKSPFSTRLWTIRAAVQRGFEALYTVQELHHLMTSPAIAHNPLAVDEIRREIDLAVSLLSQSIGIRTISGNTPRAPSSSILPTDFVLDGGHVGAILQTPKGKKLMSRSLKLLVPEHRWALLPVILARMFLATSVPITSTKAGVSAPATDLSGLENQAIEHKLLRTIIEFLQYSFQYQIQQQNANPPGIPAEFTNVLITHLRSCMKSVLVTQMEKSKLRHALVTDRVRAEVMHMIVQIGDKVATVCDLKLREDWIQTREAFMSTLDS